MRKNLSWRHATSSDLDRVSYTQTIARWTGNTGLSRRATRVLGFFSALNRLGTFGYAGTRCSQPALARAVSRATGEAASVPTIQRSLRELREQGFIRVGTAYGKTRRTFSDTWQREPIRVYTLTRQATDLWSTRPRKVSSDLRKVGCLTTYIKMEPFRSSELKLENFKPAGAIDRSVITSAPQTSSRNEVNKMTTKDLTRVYDPQEESHREQKEQKSSRPSRFRGVPEHSLSSARKRLLSDICLIVSGRGRAGRMIQAKAALSLSDPAAETGIDWPFWLTRWPMMTRGERMGALRQEIVPVLNTWIQKEPKPIDRPAPEIESPKNMKETFDGLKKRGFDADLLARLATHCV